MPKRYKISTQIVQVKLFFIALDFSLFAYTIRSFGSLLIFHFKNTLIIDYFSILCCSVAFHGRGLELGDL